MIFLAALSVCFSAYAIGPEIKTMTRDRDEVRVFLSAINSSPQFENSFSYVSRVRQMTLCDDLMSSVSGALMGQAVLESVAQGCIDHARRVLMSSPTMSLAHLVYAHAAFINGNTEQAITALQMSQATAPSEGGQATRRMRLAFKIGPEQLGAPAISDARLMVQDQIYRTYLATYFVADPEKQDWVVDAVSDVSGRDLRAFYNLIRAKSLGDSSS
ncbi:hypothetical protein [Yoonia maritima]|uniref:hypothetical protein n=1 Tax=Yoonia maritima TaxID=1435347 RepID=UPI0013A6734B|nr:hypothetical protein [Yoonia maritima]